MTWVPDSKQRQESFLQAMQHAFSETAVSLVLEVCKRIQTGENRPQILQKLD